MDRLFVRFFMVVAMALAASTALKARAGTLAELDATAVQGVILAQLAAFADDDAEGAFATATPAVRDAVGTPWRFLALVRGAYPMVYRAASVTFHKPDAEGKTVVQTVEIKDGEDKSWLGVFVLEKQQDSTWRISGCAVTENTWKSA
jgi:hypothetical protein